MNGNRLPLAAATLVVAAGLVGWVQQSSEIWLKGPVYLGSSKVQISNAAGTLSFSAATSLTSSITAFATGGQGSATQLSSDISIITTCATAGDSVKLPAAASGRIMSVTNSGAAALAVFPGSGGTIDGGSANASVTIAPNGTQVFRGISSSAWKSSDPVMVNGQPSALTLFDPITVSLSAAVSAAGSSKTDATAITKELNVVTSATALQGVTLLAAAAGTRQKVVNETAVSIIVYPLDASNDTLQVDNFSALATDAGWLVPPLGSLDCTPYTTTAIACTSTQGARATVAGAGTNQATGTALTSVNINSAVTVTGSNGTVAITLPTGSQPGCITIMSEVTGASNTLLVFGHNSDDDTINGAAADAVYTQMAGTSLKYCTVNGVAWLTY
jgi:hypothetical protein